MEVSKPRFLWLRSACWFLSLFSTLSLDDKLTISHLHLLPTEQSGRADEIKEEFLWLGPSDAFGVRPWLCPRTQAGCGSQGYHCTMSTCFRVHHDWNRVEGWGHSGCGFWLQRVSVASAVSGCSCWEGLREAFNACHLFKHFRAPHGWTAQLLSTLLRVLFTAGTLLSSDIVQLFQITALPQNVLQVSTYPFPLTLVWYDVLLFLN